MKNILKIIQDEQKNIIILNYFMMFYIASLLTFYKFTGTLIYIILLIFLFNPNKKQYIKDTLKNRVVLSFILYFIIYIIWMIGSEHKDVALYQIKLNLLLLYPILFVSILRKEFVKNILRVFLIVLFLTSVWSIFMYFGFVDSPFRVDMEPIPFLYKSDFGFFILLAIAMSFIWLVYDESLTKLERNFLYIAILLFIFNIFIIGARIYMFICFIMFFQLLFILRNSKYFKYIKTFIIICIFLLASIYMFNNKAKSGMDNIIVGLKNSIVNKNYVGSAGERVAMVLNSLPVIKKNPIFGVGAGDQISEVKKVIKNQDDYDSGRYKLVMKYLTIGKSSFLHNTYIQHLVEFGIVGLLVFLNIFFQLYKYKYIDKKYKYTIYVLIFVYLLMGVSGAEFMFNQAGKFFVFIVSLMIVKNERFIV